MSGFNDSRYAVSDFSTDSPVEMARIRHAIALLAAHAPQWVLDVGCTDGLVSRFIKKSLPASRITGVDSSVSALEEAAKICNEVYRVDLGAEGIPLADASVDGIYAGEIIEHVFYTEDFLEELLRVSKRGGVLVLTTPNMAAWFNRVFVLLGQQPFFTDVGVRVSNNGNRFAKAGLPPGHIRNFTPSSLRNLLERTGWVVEKFEGQGLLGNWLHLPDRWISRIFPSLASDLMMVCRKP